LKVLVTANWRSKPLDFRWHLSLLKKRKGWLSCRSSLSVAAYQAGLNLDICLSVRQVSRWYICLCVITSLMSAMNI
ncbi:Os02g0150600, partial [Oryza sativa Japonica Group]